MVNTGANSSVRNRGFTLLEVVLVIGILAVLAVIAIPRLGSGTSGASDAAVEADTETLQKAIDLYIAEHHGQYPDASRIAEQLTQYTDMRGHVLATPDGTHIYGPYVHAIPPLPVGPRKGGTRIATADGEGVGWIYTPTTGQIQANIKIVEATATEVSR